MNRILSIIKFDLTNALRDSMVVYILVAPLLLAGGLRLFLPSFEGSEVTYAVQAPTSVAQVAADSESATPTEAERRTLLSAATRLSARLEDYGRVETYETAESVRDRVLRTDDVGGFVLDPGADPPWSVVLEGNEGAESEAVMRSVLLAATAVDPPAEYAVTQTDSRSPFKEYASVGLVMLASLIGGLAVSFAMIDEKEQNVTRAFTVTPMSGFDYFAARGILAAVVGFVVATVGHLILVGTTVPFGRFVLALVVSAPLPLVVALLVGGIAKNQIQAVAALKVVMMLYLTVPFVSIAVPRSRHWLFYVFPNYWMFRSFEDIYVTGARAGDLPLAAAVTLGAGIVTLVLLGIGLGKQLKPQRGMTPRTA
ncbi:MAG: ABC transporter permease [Spirochaetota bacterium]